MGIKKLGLGLWLQMIIGHFDKRLRLGIRIVGLWFGIGVRDCDWALGLEIGIRDWALGCPGFATLLNFIMAS